MPLHIFLVEWRYYISHYIINSSSTVLFDATSLELNPKDSLGIDRLIWSRIAVNDELRFFYCSSSVTCFVGNPMAKFLHTSFLLDLILTVFPFCGNSRYVYKYILGQNSLLPKQMLPKLSCYIGGTLRSPCS